VIEDEELFKNYLVYKKSRKLTVETANSYISYLNSIKAHIDVDITRDHFKHIGEVNNIVFALRSRMPEASVMSCKIALKAYLNFNRSSSKKYNYPDENLISVEGAIATVKVNKYERDATARLICISHHKPICKVCRFDFFKAYGMIGEGFIHIHHLVPLSLIGRAYVVDPIADLVPVCPNCHAMLHRRNPPFSIEELISIISSRKI
jgi:5-methylcytosine-specific restriction protein A